MTHTFAEIETKDGAGYYTPKNILNPAMFRLAEITRALSEVNMDIEQEKSRDRRHTISIDETTHDECDRCIAAEEHIEKPEDSRVIPDSWLKTVQRHEDEIGKALIVCIFVSLVLLALMLILSV
ncbi:hypothetical protein L3Y34_001413 [Caenorhabditis briggsae]|uniref:Uncharacterized protein n=1 Tax=Caenorhabditis briggsae TaxID=6238 RepID=A0AAE9DC53_CAEBR|nr:hypothetical protein L3Y34_001413 [Caenorhabditis briggsae]